MRRLTFHNAGGTVLYDARHPLDQRAIARLTRLLADEAVAAAQVGASAHFRAATELQIQLTAAAHDAARWRSAARPIRTNPQREETHHG